MGFFDLFSKQGRKTRSLEKNIRTVANKRAADEERYAAYEALAEEGRSAEDESAADPEKAIYGLLLRFTYVKEIGQRSRSTDEEDKRYVHDLVVGFGERAKSAVHRFLLAKEGPVGAPKHSISWALRILEQIVTDPAEHWSILKEVLDDNEPGYERDSTRKLELLTYLGGAHHLDAEKVCSAIIPYLEDSDENVRFDAAETLLKQGHDAARPALAEILTDDTESMQQRSLILSGFIAHGWMDEVEKLLPQMPAPALKAAIEELEKLLPVRDFAQEQQRAQSGAKIEKPKRTAELTAQQAAARKRHLRARDLLITIAEGDEATAEIRGLVSENLARSGVTVQGARGRVEKILPKGYKVRKQRVERLPEGMREPYLSLAAGRLMKADRLEAAEPLIKILRSAHTDAQTRGAVAEHLASQKWPLQDLVRQAKKHLPPGYRFNDEGVVVRDYKEMYEPYLTQAADNLLDPYLSEPPDDAEAARSLLPDDIREALLEIALNSNTDERTLDRIMDRFAAYGWSVRDHEKQLQRVLPEHYRISAPRGAKDSRIIKVSTLI
jgi:HEAT repeat protein